jgi:hypothetical protein
MNLEILTKNLAHLIKKDPALAEAVNSIRSPGRYVVATSKKGPPSLSLTLPDGKKITLHSTYDPVKEAGKFIDLCVIDNYSNFIVLGLGMGYHIQELVSRVPRSSKIIIFEKEMEVFFCCLANIDFTSVINHPGVQFQIGMDTSSVEGVLEPDRIHFSLNGYATIKFKPLVNAEIEYYSQIIKKVDAIFNETQIDLNTQAAFSKIFFRNIFENWKHIFSSPGVHSLKNKYLRIPAIIVSAGPSLDKNIAILKESANRVLVIAVATALRPLVKNNITVDFVVAVDPDDSTLQFFDFEKIPENIWLIFDPCVPSAVVDKFPDRKIHIDSGVCLSRWLASRQGEDNFLGKTLSVAHAAFLLSRFFGCSPIILTGQDLSFNQSQLHCTDSYYDQTRKDKIGARQPLKLLEDNKYNELSPSFKSGRNIFGKEVVTTSALNIYREIFAETVDGNTCVYNATEGGLPISGVLNVTLREAINTFCSANNRSRINSCSVEGQMPKQLGVMNSELMEQSERFNKIVLEIQKMQSICINPDLITGDQKQSFVGEMDKFYRFLLDQPETLKLLQGYSYMEFIEWNQENVRILKKEENGPKSEILEDKFNRDKKFLNVLVETAETLRNAFKKMALEIN